MQLVLDTHGLVVKQRKGCFWVIGQKARRLISPERVSSIAVTADCMLSTAAIRLAVERHIPIFFHGETGGVEAKLWSPYFVGLASLRRAQALWLEDGAHWIPWGIRLAKLKTLRQLEHLRACRKICAVSGLDAGIGALENALDDLYPGKLPCADPDLLRQQLLGLEGTAARSYWQALSEATPERWRFEGRSRRPAQDPFNAALNYLYGMLYPVVENAVFAAGLDPYMGMLHAEEYDRPALAFDLIEPFRPWVDALVAALCREDALDITQFEPRDGGWWVGKTAKAVLIPRFNDFLETELAADGETRAVRNHIHAFAGALADDIRAWYENREI